MLNWRQSHWPKSHSYRPMIASEAQVGSLYCNRAECCPADHHFWEIRNQSAPQANHPTSRGSILTPSTLCLQSLTFLMEQRGSAAGLSEHPLSTE